MTSVPDDFDRSKLKDRKWKGEEIPINHEIARTPTEKRRRCTDVLCCILFNVFLVGMLASTIYGYVNGDPGKLIAPIDGDLRICGYDDAVKDYPKLYIAHINDASEDPTNLFEYAVCVESCPDSIEDPVACVDTTKIENCDIPAQRYETTEILNYCKPIKDTLPQTAKDNWDAMKSTVTQDNFGGAFAELMEARWVLLISAGVALLTTLIYIKFMDWCAFWLSWISVFLVLFSLVGSGIWAYCYRQNRIEEDPGYADTAASTWVSFYAWSAWIAAGIYLLVMICSFNSLRVAIAVIETAADYFADTKRIVFVPLLYFFLGICMFVMWVAAMICVSSIGEITAESANSQSKDIEWSDYTAYSVWYMVFGFLWIVSFLIACNEFVVIVSAVTWYYSDKTIEDDDGIPGDSDVRFGFWWSVRYHMGSLAFGSFLLAIVWIIRFIFEYIGEKMVDAAAGNGCTKCIFCCINCCLDCFDRFVRYINRNAYIYMALSGESFCSSALNSFILILKNSAKFSFVEGIADVFMFLAKFFISATTTGISWLLIEAMTDVENAFFPLFVIFLLSYLIAAVFIAVFDVSANTILQCYLMDKEIAAQNGLPDPDHIPPTMEKFFKNSAVQEKLTNPVQSTGQKGAHDEDTQNLLQ